MQSADDLRKQLLLLNRVGNSLRHTNDFPQVCKIIVSEIIAETDAENCSLYVLDSRQQCLYLRAAMGKGDPVPVFFHDDSDDLTRFRLGEGILGQAALQRRPFFIDDVEQNSEFIQVDKSPVAVKSLLCVPVIDGDELLGGINLSHSQPGVLGQPLLALLEIIADQTAKALKNALLIMELQQINKHLEQEVVKGYRKLADSEKKYRFLVEQAAEGIVTTKDGIILYANPPFWKMAGYDERIPGVALHDILDLDNRQQLVTPCQYQELRAQDTDSYKPEFHFETDMKHCHGYPVKVEVTGCQVPDDHGFVQQFYVHDISDRVRLDKMKDTFFASLVHELKTPITVINSYLQQLIGDLTKHGERRQQLFAGLDKASKRLIQLLNDILAYSRLNHAEKQLNMRRWPINDEILNTIDYFGPLLEEKNIKVTSELQADVQPFLFDREKIGQVLVNLMDNAVKFTGAGGEITWRSREVAFDDRLGADVVESVSDQRQSEADSGIESAISISIEDTGCGIPEDESQKVFDEFYTSNHGEGSGLGLSICRKIVRYHDGCITAERTDRGSRFSFILPVRITES